MYDPSLGHSIIATLPGRDPLQQLTDLRDQSLAYDQDKHDYTCQASALHFTNAALLELPGADLPLALTEHALRQLYAKLGPGHFGAGTSKPLPFDYLQAHQALVKAILLNGHCHSPVVAEREWKVRAYKDTGRAVLHGSYPAVANTLFLDSVLDAINGKAPADMKIYRPFLDPDRIIARIMWHDTGRDDKGGGHYGLGTFLSNDEIGGGRIKVWPLIQQTSCTNSIIFRPLAKADTFAGDDGANYDEEADTRGDFVGLSLVHRGDQTRLTFMLKEAIGLSLKAAPEYLERMLAAETRALPDFTDILNDLTEKYRWSEATKTQIAVGTNGQQTLAGLVSGVTFAAQQLTNPVDVADMEALGGTILVSADSLFGRAARRRVEVPVR